MIATNTEKKSTIAEIEEMKRKEIELMESIAKKASQSQRSPPRDSRSSRRYERKYEKRKKSRSPSRERPRKSPERPKYPVDWAEIKQKNLDLNEVKQMGHKEIVKHDCFE